MLMVKIESIADCGNSPKKIFIKDFLTNLAETNMKQVIDSVTDDISWDMVGLKKIEGITNFQSYINKNQQNLEILKIHSIITHGKQAASNGQMVLQDGTILSFADFYNFSSAKGSKIKSIITYKIHH